MTGLAVLACGSSPSESGEECSGDLASLTVSPNEATLEVGGSVGLIATGEDDCGDPVSTPSVSFSSSDSDVALVVQTSPSTATVNGESPGVAIITVQGEGRTALVSITVNEADGGGSLSLADYFPFGTGTRWTYALTGGITLVDEDQGPMVVDGQTWRQVCGTGLYGGSDPDEDSCNLYKVDQSQAVLRPMFGNEVSDQLILLLRAPITVGDSWTSGGATLSVVSIGPRQIGAFQFNDVVLLRVIPSDPFPEDPDRIDLYIAPNVGLAEGEFFRDSVLLGTISLTGFSAP